MTPRGYLAVGIVALGVLVLQQAGGWRWEALAQWQDGDIYRQLTGFTLVTFVLHQWYFPWLRLQHQVARAVRGANLHKLLGAVAPLLYLLHARHTGYAYQLWLSLVFLGVFATGLINPETAGVRQPWFRAVWIPVHVGLSTALPFLVAYHVFVTYWYE